MSRNTKTKKHMSSGTKWIITFFLFILAISMVIICAKNGLFHFEAGNVTANDSEQALETATPEESENTEGDASDKYSIFVTAGNGGTVNPSGSVTVDAFDSINLSFTPDEGYVVQSVTLDGEELGAVDSYTISYVDANHTVVATFDKAPEEPEGGEGGIGGTGGNTGGRNIITDFAHGIHDIIGEIIGDGE